MNFNIWKNLQRKLVSILVPIFLFSMALPTLAAAASNGQEVLIVIKVAPDNVASLIQNYSLSKTELVFAQSTDSELSKYFTAATTNQNFLRLQNDSRVESVNLNFEVATSAMPNDPYFTTNDLLEEKQWYLPKIKMPQAWEFSKSRRATTVAIVDTGIHASHVELDDGRVIAGYNSISKEEIAANADSDNNGHGTAVSGIIGAISNNGRGLAGIAKNVKLMPIKALRSDGKGNVAAVSAGIVWAADNGADIINLSLGGTGFGADEALNAAIRHAYEKGVLVISAAGNDLAAQGSNLDTSPVYPICADNGLNMVLGVAASDVNDVKADFSNFGINCVDITAPGKKILTTAYLPSDPSDNVLIYGSGTSVATPIVSGVAALLKSNRPTLSHTEIRDILIGTADDIDNLNKTNCLGSSCAGFLGHGRINAASALNPLPLINGLLIENRSNNKIYIIESGLKRYVSPFVFQQRGFNRGSIVIEERNRLDNIPTGEPLPPSDGTLIKAENDEAVYIIEQGIKHPISARVFSLWKFSFDKIIPMGSAEVRGFETGNWYAPPDGTVMVAPTSPTVYAMNEGIARPVTGFVFRQRGFSFGKVLKISNSDSSHLPKASDGAWLSPLDGTLVKASNSPTVYLIKNQAKHALSPAVFNRLKFSYANVRVLPQAEVDVILNGEAMFN